MILLLLLQAITPSTYSSSWYSLLQTQHTWKCSADYLISDGGQGILTLGLPLAALGSIPEDLPWPDASIKGPLESGIWGGGGWNTAIQDGTFQDTNSVSRIGLIQNTMDHSRYVFELNRPLPGSSSGNFELIRDDSLALYSTLAGHGGFDLRISSWEGGSYGWGIWSGWRNESVLLRTGFSRLYADDRRPEFLTSFKTGLGSASIELGGAGALVDSSVQFRTAVGLCLPVGGVTASLNADYSDDKTGFWGGLTGNSGSLGYSAVYSAPGGCDPFQLLSLRHRDFTVLARFSDNAAAAADYQISRGVLRGKVAGCWFFQSDSLEVNCHTLFGLDWYRGRIEAGPRFTGCVNSAGDWAGKLDVVLGFTLLPFSMGAGVEDITGETERSWSFGITWAFSDGPPVTSEGEGSGRERG